MKKYLLPLIMLSIFETIAITLWLTQNKGCVIILGFCTRYRGILSINYNPSLFLFVYSFNLKDNRSCAV